jgi:integral membrane sensor domain MASE1
VHAAARVSIRSLMEGNGLMHTEKRRQMELFIMLFIVLIVLDLATLRWGFDSRDGMESHQKTL